MINARSVFQVVPDSYTTQEKRHAYPSYQPHIARPGFIN